MVNWVKKKKNEPERLKEDEGHVALDIVIILNVFGQ